MTVRENHPYLALVVGGPSTEVFLVAERIVFESLSKVSSISVVLITDYITIYHKSFHLVLIFLQVLSVRVVLIAGYFALNMAYPKPLYVVLIFVLHLVLGIKDPMKKPVVL